MTQLDDWKVRGKKQFFALVPVRFSGTVLGTEFGPESKLERYVVRILVRKNPYRNRFCLGTVRGTERNFEKLKK